MTIPNLPIPPMPKNIIEALEPAILGYLENPSPAAAFYLGVECEYLGHCDPDVQYAARTVLACVFRDIEALMPDARPSSYEPWWPRRDQRLAPP